MERKSLVIGGLTALMIVPALMQAQTARERERRTEQELERARRGATAFAYAFGMDDRERPRLGITTESSGARDTLGLLVSSVTEDGPAAKAGIKEGDRLQSVNGVNLRLAREDAGEEDMEGIATRRLIRTLGKAKIGDEVDLRVWSDGSVKSVKVKTVSVEDLEGSMFKTATAAFEGSDRASLGIGIGSSGSRRDTLGILVSSVVDDGPAAKAGLIEGDRIQSINGVDLRVPAEDAGDWAMSNARARRLTRELEKAKAGDEVELRVYSGGSSKTVRIKTVSASELPSHSSFFFGDGPSARTMVFPRGQAMVFPRGQAMTFPRGQVLVFPRGQAMTFPRGQMLRAAPVLPRGTQRLRQPLQEIEGAMLKQRLEQTLPKIAPMLRRVRPVITI